MPPAFSILSRKSYYSPQYCKYTTPARIKLCATAIDEDGKIKGSPFNGTTPLHTEDVILTVSYANILVGNCTHTAKAFACCAKEKNIKKAWKKSGSFG